MSIDFELGLTKGGSDLMPLRITYSLASAEAKSIILLHGDSVYTTISCTNSMDLTQEVTSEGNIVISQPPASTTAYAKFLPVSQTVFDPRDSTQLRQDQVQLEFHGFTDITDITVRHILI